MSVSSYEGMVVLNYRLVKKLGEGGFGVVYLAEHTEIGRRAACKILYPEFVRRPDLVQRFFNEARVVCTIGHRSIIDIQNFGELPSGEPFFLMEYFAGEDLSSYIKRNGPLSLPLATKVFDTVAQGLSAAHGMHVIHRDLKPGNIMVRGRNGDIDAVRLLDFGIAKLLDSADSSSSHTGVAMGTPTYMAPEQARDSKNVDQRADVYGFAATLFAALTGCSPFQGESYPELILAVATHPPPRLGQFLPSVPAELDAVVARCMSKDAAQRPGSIDEAWTRIRTAMTPQRHALAFAQRPGPPWTPGPDTGPPPGGFGETTLASAGSELRSPSPRRRRRWGWISLGSAMMSLIALTVFLAVSSEPEQAPTPSEKPSMREPREPDASPSTPDASPSTPDASPSAPETSPSAPDASPSTPDASPSTPDIPPRSRSRCSKSSFRKIYEAADPRKASVEQAFRRLRDCRDSGAIDQASYDYIQNKLVGKL